MERVRITSVSMLETGESTIVVGHLDQPPPQDWAETFDRLTVTAVFGFYPHLHTDTIQVVTETPEATRGVFAVREAVTLTNALVGDHERLAVAWAVGAASLAA